MQRNYIIHPHGFWFSPNKSKKNETVKKTIEDVLINSSETVVIQKFGSDDPLEKNFLEYLDRKDIKYHRIFIKPFSKKITEPTPIQSETQEIKDDPDTVIVLAPAYAAMLYIHKGDKNLLFGCFEESCLKNINNDSISRGATASFAPNGTLSESYLR